MVFFLTTMDQQGASREFSLMGDLEVACKLFDHIAKKGHILLKASVVDGDRSSDIPLESFYGPASWPVIEALEREWSNILSKPINIRSVCARKLPDMISRRVERHQACIFQLEQAVVLAEQRLQRVSATILREPHRGRMLHQLEGVLNRHQQNLVTERASLSKFLDQATH
ncbi:hypothetical protein EXU85_20255 [Spirosoma sp. KCTC 42546]|uniref:hypothetical protein n=1 Tax=Spirosoma sp. KCTC 42546 TaxID=2520506 RepID=UPI001159F9C1|nr:hypothetical protein [Spirosoma sp. KCTC 42546]QDK80812.1 hypothetical protein EXU85_20255 [Spirosoma sp. KCTC 42546]